MLPITTCMLRDRRVQLLVLSARAGGGVTLNEVGDVPGPADMVTTMAWAGEQLLLCCMRAYSQVRASQDKAKDRSNVAVLLDFVLHSTT